MNKLFTNDKFFRVTVISSVLFAFVFAVCRTIIQKSLPMENLVLLLFALCAFFLYQSYQKHSKNVMKGLMGAFLMAQLINALTLCSAFDTDFDQILAIIYAVLALLLFVNHFIINSDHHSKPCHVRINQILCAAILFLTVFWSGCWLVSDFTLLNVFSELASVITHAGSAVIVVCVESRLDAYRLNREKAGWTEEKGYPKGYVHEYEKKDNK